MAIRPAVLLAILFLASAWVAPARAATGCAGANGASGDAASRIAAIACAEHALWYSPFIDEQGRLASLRISEAEALRLADGTPAWRRVAGYWESSGVGWPGSWPPAGADCRAGSSGVGAALCRTFLVDTPWSAIFVSHVMAQAGVPGFRPSARHVDYVRDAHRGGGPYRLADPDAEAPGVGDMLCFVRMSSQAFGHAGFRHWLERSPAGPLPMHCDVVVSTAGNRARLIGGNVLQGVTMRVFPLNRAGRFWNLPRRTGNDPECSPDTPAGCNFHRQDWVALLKLDPRANVPAAMPAFPSATPCCTVCSLPMPAGMRRCPLPSPVEPAATDAPAD